MEVHGVNFNPRFTRIVLYVSLSSGVFSNASLRRGIDLRHHCIIREIGKNGTKTSSEIVKCLRICEFVA